MAKFTSKILRYKHRKIFKYVWSFFNIMNERVKSYSHKSKLNYPFFPSNISIIIPKKQRDKLFKSST